MAGFKDSRTLSICFRSCHSQETQARCFMLTFFLCRSSSPLLHCGFSHIFIHGSCGNERNKSDEGRGGGAAASVGGVASHDSEGMSACPWEGRRCLATNAVFVFPSVCLCLVLSHNFALFFLPPFHVSQRAQTFVSASENFSAPPA